MKSMLQQVKCNRACSHISIYLFASPERLRKQKGLPRQILFYRLSSSSINAMTKERFHKPVNDKLYVYDIDRNVTTVKNINYCVRGGHKPARWPRPTSPMPYTC